MRIFVSLCCCFLFNIACAHTQKLSLGPEFTATYSSTGLQLNVGVQGKVGKFNMGVGPRVNLSRMAKGTSGPWGFYTRGSYLPSGYRAKKITGSVDLYYAMTFFPSSCPTGIPCNDRKTNLEYEVGLGYGMLWWVSEHVSMRSSVSGSMLRRSYYNPISQERYQTIALQPIISLGAGLHW